MESIVRVTADLVTRDSGAVFGFLDASVTDQDVPTRQNDLIIITIWYLRCLLRTISINSAYFHCILACELSCVNYESKIHSVLVFSRVFFFSLSKIRDKIIDFVSEPTTLQYSMI